MIEGLVGNLTAERVLLYLANYGEGHISGIANTFRISKTQVSKQLHRLENGGIVVAQSKGNLRVFQINPRSLIRKELLDLLNKTMSLLPPDEIAKYYRQRRRPRRTRKSL